MAKNSDKDSVTTIQVKKVTAEKLRTLFKVYGDNYDIIINRLLEEKEKPE